MEKQLTEKQQKFLDALAGEAKGDIRTAMRIAGYSDSLSPAYIKGALSEEIADITRNFLNMHSLRAAHHLVDVMDNPTDLGAKSRLAAVRDLLDRTGHKGVENVNITNDPLFILPAKKQKDDDD